MFNIGGGEVLVIAFIALIVLGPQRLPDAARQAGKAIGELRRLSSGFQSELRDAFSDAELTSPVANAPRRDVLAQPPAHTAPPSAVDSVSGQAPRRREPLRAAPATNTKTASSLPKGTKPRGKGA